MQHVLKFYHPKTKEKFPTLSFFSSLLLSHCHILRIKHYDLFQCVYCHIDKGTTQYQKRVEMCRAEVGGAGTVGT